jgi:subtilase family serine protease
MVAGGLLASGGIMTTFRPMALLLAVLAASLSIAVWTAPSRAQASVTSALTVLHASASPLVPEHSSALGALEPAADVHLDVTLKLPDPSEVSTFIASLSDRSSPNFRHFLRPGQFGHLFGPSLTEVAAVDAVLRARGLHPGQVSSNHLSIPVTAPASVVDRAFRVNLLRYRLPGGRAVFTTLSAPSISASVAADVQGVIGLSDLVQPQSSLVRSNTVGKLRPSGRLALHVAATSPTPCAAATTVANAYGGYTANQLSSYYDMTPLYAHSDFGQGVNIALVEFEPNSSGDIAAYQSCFGTSTTVNYTPVDGGAGPDPTYGASGSGEAALDIEDIIGLAPRATIDVYQGPVSSDTSNVLDVYSAIVNADADQVVSTGWGECEPDSDPALLSAQHNLFSQAATQGQAVFAAAGDTGSTDCFGDPATAVGSQLAVDDPASQPYVIGVGGTSLGAKTETAWNDSGGSNGAGGGGVSAKWCMPSYQDRPDIQGLISSDSLAAPTACGTKTPYMREVPDVSADGDPVTGYITYWNGSWQGGEGGTSAAAPLWAAAAALIDSSPYCADYGSSDATGTLSATLYAIAESDYYSSALSDVTRGSNSYAPSNYLGALYHTTKGYDMATGLGTPLLAYPGNYFPGLAALTCFMTGTKLTRSLVTGVSPKLGPSNRPTRVTIGGSGFLPRPGADRLEVGTKVIAVSCETATRCTGVLPATRPGTDNLVMSVADLTVSSLVARDRFTFEAAPRVVALVPDTGPANGSERVTIRGSDFVGKVSVRFGSELGTRIRVLSSSEITVTAPAGSGGVYVTVSAIGGVSNPTTSDKYRYAPA